MSDVRGGSVFGVDTSGKSTVHWRSEMHLEVGKVCVCRMVLCNQEYEAGNKVPFWTYECKMSCILVETATTHSV